MFKHNQANIFIWKYLIFLLLFLKIISFIPSHPIQSHPILSPNKNRYYLIYIGEDNLLPRNLLARSYRRFYPELSYISPYLQQEEQEDEEEEEEEEEEENNVVSSSSESKKKDDLIQHMRNEYLSYSNLNLAERKQKFCIPPKSVEKSRVTILDPDMLHEQIVHVNDDEASSPLPAAAAAAAAATALPTHLPIPKIKIAFLSAFWYHHSVGLLLQEVISGISRNLYTVLVISLNDNLLVELDNTQSADQNSKNINDLHYLDSSIPVFINNQLILPRNSPKRIVNSQGPTHVIFNSAAEIHIFTVKNINFLQVKLF